MLCVDIGNTAIKLARVSNRRVSTLCVVASTAGAAPLARAIRRAAGEGVDAVAVSSVRPQSTALVRLQLRAELGIDPLVVTARRKLPIVVDTRRPARVGIDRICAACGALPGAARDAIVVDAGSAITVDLVLGLRFTGGVIMPGPQMMLTALHQFTAQLPDLKLADHGDAIDDTAPAMQTGVAVGAAGAIEAAVELLRSRGGRKDIPVWLTGGHAERLRRRLPSRWKYQPNLTLIGLARIAGDGAHHR